MFNSYVFCFLWIYHLVVFCDGIKTIAVLNGDSVTLHPNTETKIQREDFLTWKFGGGNYLIAEINAEADVFKTYDGPERRFRDRLKLDHQTGSLTITNTTTDQVGVYLLTISAMTETEYRFNVTVYDCAFCCESEAVIRLALSVLVGVATVVVLVYDIRSSFPSKKGRTDD